MIQADKKCIKCGNKFEVIGVLLSVVRRKVCDNCSKVQGRISGRKYRAKNKERINQKRKEIYAKTGK